MPYDLSPDEVLYLSLNINGMIRNDGMDEARKLRYIRQLLTPTNKEYSQQQIQEIVLIKRDGEIADCLNLAIERDLPSVFQLFLNMCGGLRQLHLLSVMTKLSLDNITAFMQQDKPAFSLPPPLSTQSSASSSLGSSLAGSPTGSQIFCPFFESQERVERGLLEMSTALVGQVQELERAMTPPGPL